MNVWSMLGFGTNWERISKMQKEKRLEHVGRIIHCIAYLSAYHQGNELKDVEAMIKEKTELFEIDEAKMAEEVYRVVKAFGTTLPNRKDYSEFDLYNIDSVPSKRDVKKLPQLQQNWDLTCEWAKEYEKNRSETIIAEKNTKIKELEAEVKRLELKVKKLELEKKVAENER